MRSMTKLLLVIVLSALSAGPTAWFAKSEPEPTTNQCIMIPEVVKGQETKDKPTVPYQPDSCVALNSENYGSEGSAKV